MNENKAKVSLTLEDSNKVGTCVPISKVGFYCVTCHVIKGLYVVQGTAVRVNTILHMYCVMMMRSTRTPMSLVVSREGSI